MDDLQYEQLAIAYAADGVYGSGSDTAVVYADSSGRQVKIRANKRALVRGHMWSSGTSEVTKTLTTNTSGSTRVDLVVLGLSRTTWEVTCYVKAGTPGAGAPALQQDTGSTGIYEIALASMTLANNYTTVASTDVTTLVTSYLRPSANLRATLNKTGTNQSLAATTDNLISWSSQLAHSSAGIWNTTNPTRVTFPVTGTYRVQFRGNSNLTSSGFVCWLRYNGTGTRLGQNACAAGSWGTGLWLQYDGDFTAADYVEVVAYQNFGSGIVLVSADHPQLTVTQLA